MALINTTTTGILGTTLFGDGAGALTVQKDGVTQGVYGNIPTFSAYTSLSQTVTSGTNTKIAFNTEFFDTSSCFDTSNYRFTPNVAGYYLVRGCLRFSIASASTSRSDIAMLSIYKNGNEFYRGTELRIWNSGAQQIEICDILYLNGTTDYIELYGRLDGTSTLKFEGSADSGSSNYTSQFSSVLVKAV
jgi:hypothetical protein